MNVSSRREFLGTALAGLGAGRLLAADKPAASVPKIPDDPSFQPGTLFLTWQQDPTTTMTVQWIGARGEAADTTVFYTTTKDGPWGSQPATVKPYPTTDLQVFRAELTGLSPGRDYVFRIGKDSPHYRFRTMPARANDTIHFISGGDCGVNAHTIANNIQAARQDPLFAVIGGDLGYDNGRSAATSLAFLRNYSKHMVGRDGRLIPMVACIGNHEVDGGYNKPRAKAPFFFALFDGLYRDTSYATLDFGDYLSLVLLDTGHIAPIAGEQTAWLDKTLRDRVDRPHLIVANHVPAYPSYRPPGGLDGTGAGNRQHWVPLFEKHNVDFVLEHHDHTFKRTHPLRGGHIDRDGIVYLGDGSWGQLRAPNSPESRSYLAAVGQAYHVTLHRFEGDRRAHQALAESGKIVDVCTTVKRPRHRPLG